jgi:hypothetical protein
VGSWLESSSKIQCLGSSVLLRSGMKEPGYSGLTPDMDLSRHNPSSLLKAPGVNFTVDAAGR